MSSFFSPFDMLYFIHTEGGILFMSLETFRLNCKRCGTIMDLTDDCIDEPTWCCPNCRLEAYGYDGNITFVIPFGDEEYGNEDLYTYDEMYTYLD